MWYPVSTKDHIGIFLQTIRPKFIDDLVNRTVGEKSVHHGANTVIVMGYFPASEGKPQDRRGLAVLKHKGSYFDQSILQYQITEKEFKIIGKRPATKK